VGEKPCGESMRNFDDNPYAVTNVTDDFNFPRQSGMPVHVPDYLVVSILMTLFCCQPLGIAAIVFSALANGEKNVGNFQNALNHAKNAKTCLLVGGIGGALITLFVLGICAMSAVFG